MIDEITDEQRDARRKEFEAKTKEMISDLMGQAQEFYPDDIVAQMNLRTQLTTALLTFNSLTSRYERGDRWMKLADEYSDKISKLYERSSITYIKE